MGYHIHHTIICTSWNEEHIKKAHQAAKAFLGSLVSDLSEKQTNNFISFFVFPDGSKEGWAESKYCDEGREKFLMALKAKNLFVDWVEVSFGGDDPKLNTKIKSFGNYIEKTEE